MLDKFQLKFVEEAQDNVAIIEESLFELEQNPDSKETIEKLFRAMHTIKGSGAMFAFNDLSHFTHNLETLYDLVRNDKLAVNRDIISLTFESLDYIRQLLDLGEGTLTDPDDIKRQNDYIAKITKYFPEGQTLTKGRAEREAEEKAKKEAEAQAGPKNYLVTFAPFDSVLNYGTNPLFMMDDLTALGKYATVAFLGAVPSLNDIEGLKLYVKWQVVLNTEQDINDIKDVFIFVEDECKMDIVELPRGEIVGDTEKLPAILQKAIDTQTELKAEDFACFKEAPKPEPAPKAEAPKADAAPAKKPAANGPAKQPEAKVSSIRVASDKIDDLVNAVSELVTMQAQLNLLASKQDDQNLISIAEQMEKITRQLRENSFSISLIPLQGELVRFQRLVRDLCNKLNKQIEFVVEGGEIELDKNIIDHLNDPLLHIIRNSGDHGIEMPDERAAAGKNPTGTIMLKAFYSGSSVVVQVSDDGKGMDPEKIFKKAVEKGVVDPAANLSKKEILNLIFASGFSTAEKISDVSGRGVGMDVVKSKIAEIRGEVTVDSEFGKGTTISMELPMTLSIIDGLQTRIGGEQFVFPLANVERILQPKEVSISDKGMGDFFDYEGARMSFIDLNKIFNGTVTDLTKSKILIVGQGDKRVGMLVDAVLGEFQIVVKPLGRFLRKVDMISGASVMGDGSLSLIIDTGRLINYFNQLRYKKKA